MGMLLIVTVIVFVVLAIACTISLLIDRTVAPHDR